MRFSVHASLVCSFVRAALGLACHVHGGIQTAARPRHPQAAAKPNPWGIDWANRDYGRRLRLTNGRHVVRRYPARHTEIAKRCRHTTYSARLQDVHYYNLTGDRAKEAIVDISVYNDGCGGRVSKQHVLIVFGRKAGLPVELARLTRSDVTAVDTVKRALVLDRRHWTKDKLGTCREKWDLIDGKFSIRHTTCSSSP